MKTVLIFYYYAFKLSAETCEENEEYKCKMSCPPETCLSIVAFFKCDADEVCKHGCYCKDGFYRANGTAPCRPTCECDVMVNSPDCQKQ